MTKSSEFINMLPNVINLNPSQLYNVIRTHLFFLQGGTYSLVAHFLRLVIRSKFRHHAIQITSIISLRTGALIVTTSKRITVVLSQLACFSIIVNGTQMVIWKLSSNVRNVDADQKGRRI